MSKYFAIRRYPLTQNDWQEIRAPMHCSVITIQNSGTAGLRLREISDDSGTELALASGAEFTIQSAVPTFEREDLIVYAKSNLGPGLAVVSFTR